MTLLEPSVHLFVFDVLFMLAVVYFETWYCPTSGIAFFVFYKVRLLFINDIRGRSHHHGIPSIEKNGNDKLLPFYIFAYIVTSNKANAQITKTINILQFLAKYNVL